MLFGKDTVPAEVAEDVERVMRAYNEVGHTEAGKVMLTDLLQMFGYWDHDPEYPNLRMAAIMVLERGGWLHVDNIEAIVDGYLNSPPRTPVGAPVAKGDLRHGDRERRPGR